MELYSCQKETRWRSKKYLDFVKTLPSILPGYGDVTFHHVRIDGNAGTSLKPSDFYTVPLYVSVHNEFHAGMLGEKEFWEKNNINIYKKIMLVNQAWIRRNK